MQTATEHMQTATEQLQAIADEWVQKLGGKVPVTLNVLVSSGLPDSRPYYGAYIGIMGSTIFDWSATSSDLVRAQDEAERKWRLDGAPVEPEQAERAKLKARAAELGLTIF